MSSEALVLLVGAGLAAGLINTLAGGGSLLTLPALIFLGMSPGHANGTNRVAVLMQNGAAIAGFARGGQVPGRLALVLVPSTILGALIGARVAVDVSDGVLRTVLAAALVLALPAVFLPEGRPGALRARRADATVPGAEPRLRPWIHLVFAAIGFYGGFIQAGVGFLLLGALVPLLGLDLVRANALKVIIGLAHTAIALPVFVAHRQVEWASGLVLAAGNMAGAWLGTRLAVLRGARFVRWILLAALVLSAAQLLELPARLRGPGNHHE